MHNHTIMLLTRLAKSTVVPLAAALLMALTPFARAETIEYWQNRNSLGDWTPFQIMPFDSSLGTLNSVTMSAEVNVSGSAQLWSTFEDSELSVTFSTTLAPVSEMGWGPTVALFSDSAPLAYYDYDLGEGYVQLDGSGNNFAFNTITAGFGRFVGVDPFEIPLQLFGEAESTYPEDILASSYDGTASLYYSYDYTVIPEPASGVLLGMSLARLDGLSIAAEPVPDNQQAFRLPTKGRHSAANSNFSRPASGARDARLHQGRTARPRGPPPPFTRATSMSERFALQITTPRASRSHNRGSVAHRRLAV